MKILIVISGLFAIVAAAAADAAIPRRSPDTQIIGGENAVANAWPWQGGLLVSGTFSCGCSIVSAGWIITAGHCVGGPVTDYTIEVGSINRGSGTHINAISVTRHPNYNVGSGYTPNDLAVIAATVPINGLSIAAVPGGLDHGENRESQLCYITGWGRTCSTCNLPVTLQEAQIPVISNTLCTTEFGTNFNSAVQICVWDQVNQNKGACNGDSGGPLVCMGSNGYWELIGATSWGATNCLTTKPSVYTRLSAFTDWICQETAGTVC